MSSEHVIEHKFDTINDAVNYAFQFEKTSLLSFDRICEILKNDNLYYVSKKQGIIPCSSISRRRISFILSTSDQFIRSGSERTCMWQLKPHNQLYLSDSTIRVFVEEVLSTNGPMTINQIVESTGLAGADESIYQRFFDSNKNYFTILDDGSCWFANQPIPEKNNFESINSALVSTMKAFPEGASIEEVSWFLCLTTINGSKSITRRSISRELSRHPDVFLHVSRARYVLNKDFNQKDELIKPEQNQQFEFSLNDVIENEPDQNDDFFDPSAFFNSDLFDF